MSAVPILTESGEQILTESGQALYTEGTTSMRVQATAPGFYNGIFRNIGDVFDLLQLSDYVPFNVSLVPPGNLLYPLYGWMIQVASTTPLVDYSLSTGGASSPQMETRGTNSAGQQVLGQAPGLGNTYVV